MCAVTRAVSPGRTTDGATVTSTGASVASAMPATTDRQNRSNAASCSARYRHASSAPDQRIRPAPCGVTITTASLEPLVRASTLAPGTLVPGTLAPCTVEPGTVAPGTVRISEV